MKCWRPKNTKMWAKVTQLQSHSLKTTQKKWFYLDLNYFEFTEINFVKYLASQTLQKWVSDLQKSYVYNTLS